MKNLKEDVILHFDLEDGTHKAIPFKSEEEALAYMDSDDFPIGEWVGDYTIEPVDSATVSASNGDEEDDFYDADDYDESFYIVLDDNYHKIQELIDEDNMPIYKAVNFSNKDDAIIYALEHPEVFYVQEMFGPDLCDCYEGDFVWERGQEITEAENGRTDTELLPGYKRAYIDFDGNKKYFENDTFDISKVVSSVPDNNGRIYCINVPVGCNVVYSKQPNADVVTKYCNFDTEKFRMTEENEMLKTKEFGDWAVAFWKKGSKIVYIAQNQGEPNTTDYWMVGTTTRQFDYESGWLPNKEWTSTIKGHFSKEKAVSLAKQAVVKEEKSLTESHKKLPSYLAKYGATHFSELWEVANCKDPEEDFNLTTDEEKEVYSEIEKLVKGINKDNFKKNIKAVYDLGKKCGSNDALFQITPYAWKAICDKDDLDEKTGKSLKESKWRFKFVDTNSSKFNEEKYVDPELKPLGKKLSHHSDDGFIDFCTAKVLDDLNKGDKKKLDFYEFWDWAAEVGSKDIVELIYNDFKNGKLDKDSAVCRFYKTYENIKDLSLKDPKKFVKQYGWAYEDKIKDKSLKEDVEEPISACWIRNGKILELSEDEAHSDAFFECPEWFGFTDSFIDEICDTFMLSDFSELKYDDAFDNETHPAWEELIRAALLKGAVRVRCFRGRTYVTYSRAMDLISAMLDFPEAFTGRICTCRFDDSRFLDFENVKDALRNLNESKTLTESEDVMKLYKGIVKGRQRQLKTEGTGMWFSSSKTVAKTYSDEVETWELDTSLPLKAVQINCHQKSWNEINTDAYARKYKDYDVIVFKDIVDVGPLVLKYTKEDDKRTTKEAFKDFTADTIVVNNKDCIKKIQKENFKESETTNPKRKLCKEVEGLVNKAVEKTYNDTTKLSLMNDGVCIDRYGTKVFMLSGGRNGDGKWNEYLQTLAQFTVELVDMLQTTYSKDADVWLVNLKNDCADDVFYPVFGFGVGEGFDETESMEWQENNTWQADSGEEVPFRYDECTNDWFD